MNKLLVATIATQILNAATCIVFAQQTPDAPTLTPAIEAPPEPEAPQLPTRPSDYNEIQVDPVKWQQMRSEILQIRQQLGFNPLAGIDLGDDESNDAQFAKTLDGVAGATKVANAPPTKKPAANWPPILPEPSATTSDSIKLEMIPPSLPAPGTPTLMLPPSVPSLPPAPAMSYRDTLLAAARKLDRKADFLEDTNEVQQARKIRRLANRIRTEALGQE